MNLKDRLAEKQKIVEMSKKAKEESLNNTTESLNVQPLESRIIEKQKVLIDKLSRENKELAKDKEQFIEDMKKEVQAVKETAYIALNNANEREEKANDKVNEYINLKKHQKENVEKLANKKINNEKRLLAHNYSISLKTIRASYGMFLLYSIIATLLLTLDNKLFMDDLRHFVTMVHNLYISYFDSLICGNKEEIICIIILSGILLIALLITTWALKNYLSENRINIWDEKTALAVYLIYAFILHAGKLIHITNLINLYLILLVIYIISRIVLQMNDKQKKDIAITGIATLILIAFVCIFSFGSLIDALKNMFAN